MTQGSETQAQGDWADQLADVMSADIGEPICGLDVLDWLATVGVQLAPAEQDSLAASAYLEALA